MFAAVNDFRLSPSITALLSTALYSDPGSQDYLERSKFISEQLSALKVQMEDLKVEDKMTHNDILHEEHFRRGGNKRSFLDRVGLIEPAC